ncbi:hypothetical protein THARTR1_06758 [Trichoderma harzianum]|uniref:Peptidase S8/S53 domain-containing protein n=1 Tax=Trichoderma harzianum TaxID=5544 RepID=A0A2K0U4K0_TRIHA|nr:hypothetical protein THARTR1_06758 [Trichoderma harzianum]
MLSRPVAPPYCLPSAWSGEEPGRPNLLVYASVTSIESVISADITESASIIIAESIAEDAIIVYGAPEILVAGSIVLAAAGLFDKLFHIIFSHHDNGGGSSPGQSSTASITIPVVTKTSTTTKAPLPTGIPTERIVAFNEDMTSGQFILAIAGLSLNGNTITDFILSDKISFYAILGNIFDADTLALGKHPLLAGIGRNGVGLFDDVDQDAAAARKRDADEINHDTPASQPEPRLKQREQNNPVRDYYPASNGSYDDVSMVVRRDLQPNNAREEVLTDPFGPVENEPFALQWLSSLWAQNGLEGNYIGNNRYLIDQSITAPVKVFLIDSGVDRRHPEFNHPNYPQAFSEVIDVTGGAAEDTRGHGTAMAGNVAGAVCGVHKTAQLVPVKVGNGEYRLWSVIRGLEEILLSQFGNSRPLCVVTMSFYILPDDILESLLTSPLNDPLRPVIERLPNNNCVVTMSGGNFANGNIDDHYPRGYGGQSTPYIVVGATDANGQREPYSSVGDPLNLGLMTLFVMGKQVLRPKNGDFGYVHQDGTSSATAMTAGMAARLLARGVPVNAVKGALINMGIALKGIAWPLNANGVFVPRGGIDIQVPCTSPVQGTAVATPTYTSIRGAANLIAEVTANFQNLNTMTAVCHSQTSHAPAVLPTETT